MAQIPPMTVTFDDGTEVRVEPKSRDMVGAEAAGYDFTQEGKGITGMYAVGYAVLQRMKRAGDLPEGLELPATLQEFIDGADVDGDDEDDAGEG
jgi:hypothetical protein